MNIYTVRKIPTGGAPITVRVPASKSMLNRALLLAMLSKGEVLLTGVSLSEDTRAFLQCVKDLGIPVQETDDGLYVHGCGGNIPNKKAEICVMSAGTAGRFLTVALAFCGGEYLLTSSPQMEKRPMDGIIRNLREAGCEIECLKEEGKLPFRLRSNGKLKTQFSVDTEKSSQFASAFLMASCVSETPVTLTLTGNRTQGSYIGITLDMLRDFHIPYEKKGDQITVFPALFPPKSYAVEPDLSGACYFYAMALLLRRKVLVEGVNADTVQGDRQFLKLLEERGVLFTQTEKGVLADGERVEEFDGFDVDMRDFSDQALTVSALAPFAKTKSVLRNLGHIRLQECDRINAIVENLTALGVEATSDGENITIFPAPVQPATIKTFEDHRVAMAFTLVGLKAGGVTIENPQCSKKTFENYFEIIDQLK